MNDETIANAFGGHKANDGWTARWPAHGERDGGEE
jgi:hypothetical protein